MMKLSSRRRWLYAALVVLIGFILLLAPQQNPRASGSTYNRAPEGYGAWYAYMKEQGYPVERWQRPTEDIVEYPANQTFLQIAPPFTNEAFRDPLSEWVEQGNTWILLGDGGFPTNAPFSTTHETKYRPVKLETTKRHRISGNETALLEDRYGAIAWKEEVGKGRIIHVVSPFLGANAYQDEPGNFAYLSALVNPEESFQWVYEDEYRNAKNVGKQRSQNQGFIWIDESIHGYFESKGSRSAKSGSWFTYLADTPLFPILIQSTIILLIVIGASNRRFGPAARVQQKSPDNSEAYIQALAGVLEKAERSEFVLDVIGRETQLQIQHALGLDRHHLDDQTLIAAWTKQTGRSGEDLARVLETMHRSNLSRRELLAWVQKLKQIQDAT